MLKNKRGNFWSGVFFIIIVVAIFEIILVIIGFYYADKVKCNLIWCEFTKTSAFTSEAYQKFVSEYNNSNYYCVYSDYNTTTHIANVTCYAKVYYTKENETT